MSTSDDLRAKADELEVLRRAGMKDAGFERKDDGQLLGVLDAGRSGEVHLTWYQAKDRAPGFSARLWTNEGHGMLPVRGVGVNVPFWQMAEFSRAVAEALDLSIDFQKNQWLRRRNGR